MNETDATLKFWQDQYEAGTTGWDRGEVHPAMLDWISEGELFPCQIVVPGCGRGHEVIHLSQLEFDVTAIDYAAAPIEFLQSQLDAQSLKATLSHGDLFEFNQPQAFDAVYEQTCLCAIDPSLRAPYADQIFDWLRPGGKLFLLMMQTGSDDGPPFHSDPHEIKKIFSENRWQWGGSEFKKYPHPSGRIYEFATVLTRKSDENN